MKKNIKFAFEKIEKRSKKRMENPQALRRYLKESEFMPITFFNWECPPRFLDNGEISYLVDIKKIFRGEKIDEFTELPRVVVNKEREIRILNYLNSLGINYRFVKIIADTNAYYLTPEVLKKTGKNEIRKKFGEFKLAVENNLKKYPAQCAVYLFSDLMSRYTKTYETAFYFALSRLRLGRKCVEKEIIEKQLKRTREHVGVKGEQKIEEFALRTIASYAAEGLVFRKLSSTKYFSNCIWLNIEEADNRTIKITNLLRDKQDSLPMIFL